MSQGVGCRRDLDRALLWLGNRPAAVARISPLAWEPQNAAGGGQKNKKKKKKKERKKRKLSCRKYIISGEDIYIYTHIYIYVCVCVYIYIHTHTVKERKVSK